MPLSSFTFHKCWTWTNCHTNCTCNCECLFAGVLQALQSWKTQICPEGEHPASLELWRDSFSAFRYVCMCVCARVHGLHSAAQELLSQMCLREPGLNWCVWFRAVFAQGEALHPSFHYTSYFSFLQGSLTPTSRDFSRFSSLHVIFDCCHPITRLSHCAVAWM